MSHGEAIRLAGVLTSDPSSHVAASMAGWPHPVSREWLVAADLFDLQHRVAAGRKTPPPYPRPWTRQATRIGAGTALTPEEFRAAWNA